MKTITLAAVASVNDAVRRPEENPLTVSDEEAKRLFDAGVLEGEPEDAPSDDGDEADKRTTRAKAAKAE